MTCLPQVLKVDSEEIVGTDIAKTSLTTHCKVGYLRVKTVSLL